MDSRLNLIERLRIQLGGCILKGEKKIKGWKKALPYYVFQCPIHGYVTSYTMGHNKRLVCPLCIKNIRKEKIGIMEQERDASRFPIILNETA